MVNVARVLRRAHGQMVRCAPTRVTIHRVVYSTDEDPMDVTAQFTVSETWDGLCTYAPETTNMEPVGDQDRLGGIITINARSIGWVPTQADRVELGGLFFNILHVDDIEGAIYKLKVAGPAPTAEEAADVTAPRVTGITINAGIAVWDYILTFNEASHHRYRYRTPVGTGEWNTSDWVTTGGYVTSFDLGGTLPLDAGTYEAEFQARDAAGNIGAWFSGGSFTVTGIPT